MSRNSLFRVVIMRAIIWETLVLIVRKCFRPLQCLAMQNRPSDLLSELVPSTVALKLLQQQDHRLSDFEAAAVAEMSEDLH